MNSRVFVCAVLLWLALLPSDAWAHRPLVTDAVQGIGADRAIFVDDIEVSQVVYWELNETTPQLWLTFEGKAGQPLYLQLGVPVLERFKDYRPAVAVLGPGLPPVTLPFPSAQANGIVMEPNQEPILFHEPFSDTDSWILAEVTLDLPQDGRYFAVLFHPQAQAGKAWVAVGKREAFGLGDMAQLPRWLREVRSFHEVPGQAPWLNIAIIVLVAALTAGVAWWVMQR